MRWRSVVVAVLWAAQPACGGCRGAGSAAGVDAAAQARDGAAGGPHDQATVAQTEGIELAGGIAHPEDVAVDDQFVYFANYNDGAIGRVPKAGGPVVKLAQGTPSVKGLAVDGDWVYWTDNSPESPMRRGMKVSKGGGAPVRALADAEDPLEIAVRAGSLYWVSGGVALRRAPLAGGEPATVVAGASINTFALDDGYAYWVNTGATNQRNGVVARKPLAEGGAVAVLTADQESARKIVIDEEAVYWVVGGRGGGAVMKLAKPGGTAADGGAAPAVLCAGLGQVMAMTGDAQNLYLSDWGTSTVDSGSVRRIDKATGAMTVMAARQRLPLGIAVDARELFWVNADGVGANPYARGTVRKVARDAVSPPEGP
jgi:hypothetical protein